jgi:tetrapyrrole methylase family protein / MazG family protein
MSEPTPASLATERLLALMARLRAPDGCAWDREQTPATLKPQMLEECYEVIEAIDSGSAEHLTEELGDLLLHVVFQAQIAKEKGDFTFADVANGVTDKMIRRHPHVFGDAKVANAEGVVAMWHELKKAEKPERQSALDGVPLALPALMRAESLQKKAAKVGFDWPDVSGSLEKVREEVAETTTEIEGNLAFAHANESTFTTTPEMAEEIGDLLFSIVNMTRHLKLDAEQLLTDANDKFARRFRTVEERVKAAGKPMNECTLEELDAAWNAVKSESRKGHSPE